MTTIASIVEGDGEVHALPVLLRRLAASSGVFDLVVPVPIRLARDRFLRREEEFRRILLLAAAKAGPDGTVLILLDADDDCPVELARASIAKARQILPTGDLSIVIANREYEAWFLSGAASLAGRRGLRGDLTAPSEPEKIRNAKGWLSERIPTGRYHEVSDQPALTAVMNIEEAALTSRSLRKLIKVVSAALVP